MSEERITERTDTDGNVTERVIERGTPNTTVVERRGGGGVLIGVILVAILAVAAFFLFDMNSSESRKDDAIADAASQAGDAAQKVGDAADKAADKLTGEN